MYDSGGIILHMIDNLSEEKGYRMAKLYERYTKVKRGRGRPKSSEKTHRFRSFYGVEIIIHPWS